MNFKPKYGAIDFNKISVDNFIEKHKFTNPKDDLVTLRSSILHMKKLKADGVTCHCGNSIWIIGSAIAGIGCFTCITGESDYSNDYEVE